jgi:hypothetical protein
MRLNKSPEKNAQYAGVTKVKARIVFRNVQAAVYLPIALAAKKRASSLLSRTNHQFSQIKPRKEARIPMARAIIVSCGSAQFAVNMQKSHEESPAFHQGSKMTMAKTHRHHHSTQA